MEQAAPTPLSYESQPLRQRARDERDLDLLAKLHNVWGWFLYVCGMIFVFHLVVGLLALAGRDPLRVTGSYSSVEEAGRTLTLVGAIAVPAGCGLGAVNRFSAAAMRERQRRRLSITAAILNLINFGMCFPLPTLLGWWTLAVLNRQSVKEAYTRNAVPAQ